VIGSTTRKFWTWLRLLKRSPTPLAWVRSQGLKADGSRRDVVLVEGTVAQVESALQCRLGYWTHEASKTTHLRTLEYTLPDEVHQHVQVVQGLTEYWPKPRGPRVFGEVNPAELKKRNDVTQGYSIPDTVRKLYNMPKGSYRKTSLGSSIAVVEFQDYGSYAHSDLTLFDQQTGEDRSHVTHVVGPFQGNNPQLESELDIQWASTLALNSSYWYWTATGWMAEFSNDLFTNPGPLVVSMSWGWPEALQCQISTTCNGITDHQYVTRVDAEFLKITATGVSLLAASGDQGAPGDAYYSGCNGLSDIFPGASPWVTSVGATMLTGSSAPVTSGPPACASNPPGCATSDKEIVCTIPEALITSGGGFASYEPMPSWQKTAVSNYLNTASNLPPSGSYNPANRAFPDISGMGHAVLIAYGGSLLQVDGTSCSTPIVASMVALLNGWRLNNGKKPLGFLNPMIYTAALITPPIFKDITSGNNACSEYCCGNMYFEATTGWDGSTGFGTPHFYRWLAYVQTLK